MKKNLNLKNFIILFIIILPIFDLVFFYNKITTLIKIIFVLTLFIITLIKYKDKKSIILFLIYFLIILLYFFIHNYHCTTLKIIEYNTFKELLYFIKMTTPFIFMYVVYKNILKANEINFIYKALILFISGSIVLSNLLCISLKSYTVGLIPTNIFHWFLDAYENYNYMDLASKGWFYFANHIIAILIMFIPIMFYIYNKKNNKRNLILFILLFLSLIMLGNKTSVFGSYIIIISILLLYLIFTKILKTEIFIKKIFLNLIIIILIYPIFIYHSPAYARVITKEGTLQNYKYNEPSKQTKYSYILDNYKGKKIPEQFIMDSYSYKEDPDFWIKIFQYPESQRINYRFLEEQMLKRVIERNNNKYDKYFGIGYDRQMNIFNLEIDYKSQYYSVGLIGLIIFIFPYFLLLGYFIIKIFNSKKFTLLNLLLIYSICLLLSIAYFTGNLLNSLSVTLPLSIIYGIILNRVKERN